MRIRKNVTACGIVDNVPVCTECTNEEKKQKVESCIKEAIETLVELGEEYKPCIADLSVVLFDVKSRQ